MANVKQIKQKTTGTLLNIEDTQARSDIATEVTNRTNADAALQTKIDNEVTARTNSDNTINQKITSEITNRTNADKALDDKVKAETEARTSADNALNQKIVEETTNRTNADNALQEKINTNKNDISELNDDLNIQLMNVFNRVESVIPKSTNIMLRFPVSKGDVIKVTNGDGGIDVHLQNTNNHFDEPLQRLGYVEANTTAIFTCDVDGATYLRVLGDNNSNGSYAIFENISLPIPTLEKKVNDLGTIGYVTPQMFGAKADGITDDKYAINMALSENKVVLLPVGTYMVSGTVMVPKDTILMGCGRESIILTDSNNTLPTLAFDESAHNSVIENLTVQGIYEESKTGRHGIFVTPYDSTKGGQFDSHNRISNVSVFDSSGCGIYVGANQRGCTFENIVIQRSRLNGFEIWGSDNVMKNLDVSVSGKYSFMCDWGSWNNRFYECKGYHAGMNNQLNTVLQKYSDLMFIRANYCHVHSDLQECVWGALKVQGNGNKLDLMIDGLGKKSGQVVEWDNEEVTAISLVESSSYNTIKAVVADGTLNGKLKNILSISDNSYMNVFDIATNNPNLDVLKTPCHFNNIININGIEYKGIKYPLNDVANTFSDIKTLNTEDRYSIELNIDDVSILNQNKNGKLYFQANVDSNIEDIQSVSYGISLEVTFDDETTSAFNYESTKKGILYSYFDLSGIEKTISSAKFIVSIVKKDEISIDTPTSTILSVNNLCYGFGFRNYQNNTEIDTDYLINMINDKQNTLVSGKNIKTINNESILGDGNLEISGGTDLDVQINGKSIVENGVANIPKMANNKLGISFVSGVKGIMVSGSSGEINCNYSDSYTNRLNATYEKPISDKRFDRFLKEAMCDGKGEKWTDVERLACLLRMGCTVDDNGFVKWEVSE